MKEKLLKLATLNKESSEALADEKFDVAITKMQEAEAIAKEVAEDVENAETEKEEIEKTAKENIAKVVKEEIQKRASVNVSNETLSKVFEDLVEATGLVKNVEAVTKTVETLQEEVKKFAGTEDEPTWNDPEKEEVEKSKKEFGVWEGL